MKSQLSNANDITNLPGWVPIYAVRYLAHTEKGVSIRQLARNSKCHASTVLRQIRRIESRREDPLIDEALDLLGQHVMPDLQDKPGAGCAAALTEPPSEESFAQEALEILSKLNIPTAVLAVATDMDKGVVVRDTPEGVAERIAVVDRAMAQALALKDWISCKTSGRVCRYEITPTGRDELAKMLARGANAALVPSDGADSATPVRFHSQDSPLIMLARRRDRDGNPFISKALVTAGERLREDFELAQMDEAFALSASADQDVAGWVTQDRPPKNAGREVMQATQRLRRAFETLGEGLADVALRCCCYQEGLEEAERYLGWPARSGKVVLRIALTRLTAHYQAARFEPGDLIG